MAPQHDSPRLRLPFRRRHRDDAAPSGPLTVVVADDVDALREALRTTLEPEFTVVGEARDGREAVEVCRRTRPDAIVLDLNMPTYDGLEAIAPIRADSPRTTIVVLSGLPRELIADKALALGADRFVGKDAPLSELPSVIRDAVAAHPG